MAKVNDTLLLRLLYIYYFLEFARPQDIFPVLGLVKPGVLVGIPIILISLPIYAQMIKREVVLARMLFFLLLMAFSVLYTVNTYWAVMTVKAVAMTLFISVIPLVYVLNTEERVRKFLVYFLGLHVFIAIYGIMHAGRGPGAFLGDENDMGLAVAMAIPLAAYYVLYGKNRKAVAYTTLAILCFGVIASQSRGGFLAMATALIGMALLSSQRLKILSAFVVIGLVLSLFIPSEYYEDMSTITDTQDSTRQDRMISWVKGWRMYLDNPVVGVGVANFGWRINEYETAAELETHRSHSGRAAHSIYFTLLPELGTVGAIIFFLIVGGALKRLRSFSRNHGDLGRLGEAYMVSIGVFLIGGVFISVLYYPLLWVWVALSLSTMRVFYEKTG